jgi:hypothetical protein
MTIHRSILLTTRYTVQWVPLTILMTLYDWVLLTILTILFQQIISLVPGFFFFFQILVLIFTDVCGKYLREKNGDAHKGIQNVTIRIVIRIVTCLKYRDTYHDKNSVSLHS